jgi:hypothetical protein
MDSLASQHFDIQAQHTEMVSKPSMVDFVNSLGRIGLGLTQSEQGEVPQESLSPQQEKFTFPSTNPMTKDFLGGIVQERLGLLPEDEIPEEATSWTVKRVREDKIDKLDDSIRRIDIENDAVEGLTIYGLVDTEYFIQEVERRRSTAERFDQKVQLTVDLMRKYNQVPGAKSASTRTVFMRVLKPLLDESAARQRNGILLDDDVPATGELSQIFNEVTHMHALEPLGSLRDVSLPEAVEASSLIFLAGGPEVQRKAARRIMERFTSEFVNPQDEEAQKAAEALLNNPKFLFAVAEPFAALFGVHNKSREPMADNDKAFIKKVFKALGLDEEQAAEVHGASASYKSPDREKSIATWSNLLQRNIETLATIREIEPDAVQKLFKHFGIRNFFRYSPGQLIRQALGANINPHLRTQLVISATHDHNGAMDRAGAKFSARGVNTIFAEAGDLHDVARGVLASRQTLGVALDRVIISAHGSKNGIVLGAGAKGRVSSRDIVESRALQSARFRKKEIMIDDGDWVLATCSNGKKKGFAEKLAQHVGFKVVASEQVSGVIVESEMNETHIRFQPSIEAQSGPRRLAKRIANRASRLSLGAPSSMVIYDETGRRKKVESFTLTRPKQPAGQK